MDYNGLSDRDVLVELSELEFPIGFFGVVREPRVVRRAAVRLPQARTSESEGVADADVVARLHNSAGKRTRPAGRPRR